MDWTPKCFARGTGSLSLQFYSPSDEPAQGVQV